MMANNDSTEDFKNILGGLGEAIEIIIAAQHEKAKSSESED